MTTKTLLVLFFQCPVSFLGEEVLALLCPRRRPDKSPENSDTVFYKTWQAIPSIIGRQSMRAVA